MESMRLGVLLPHTKLYGGVKRFLELGNQFVDKGHDFIVFTPEGKGPSWFRFKGKVQTFKSLDTCKLDALFFTERSYIPEMLKAKAKRKIFYIVSAKDKLQKIKIYPEFEFFANSTNMYLRAKRKFGIEAFKAFGAIDTALYQANNISTRKEEKPFTIMAYGRLSVKWKGTKYVVKACERLHRKHKNIKLVLFDTPMNEEMEKDIAEFTTSVPHEFIVNHPVDKNPELYAKADVFVAPESIAGWANTSAEAMAVGTPVIATTAGTLDFLEHEKTGLVVRRNKYSIARAIERLMHDEPMRLELARAGRERIEQFDWEKLANHIEDNLVRNN
jgi:glycosyltransferase involved in cell wall biosynthesis